jgi:hypothetical protein
VKFVIRPIFFLVSVTGLACAGTIDFSALDNPGTNSVVVNCCAPGSVDVGGFTFTSPHLAFWTTGDTGSFYAGVPDIPVGGAASVSLTDAFTGSVITMTPDNGQPFSISSIDVAQFSTYAPNAAPSSTYTAVFYGYDQQDNVVASQSCSGNVLAGAQPVLTTCDFSGFSDVYSMSVTQGSRDTGQAIQFTNIVTGSADQAGAPEPSSLLLALAGIPVAALLRRRR